MPDTTYTVLDYNNDQKNFDAFNDGSNNLRPYVRATDGSGNALATETAVQAVVTALSGAATEVKQDAINTSVQSVVTALSDVATATLQGTINTTLGSIVTALASQATAANQSTIDTSIQSVVTALASQATATNQTTINTSVQSVVTALASQATETTLDACKTALEVIDNAISGSEMQVSVPLGGTPNTLSETVAATATQFNSGSPVAVKGAGVWVYAGSGNSGTVYIGGSGVSTTHGWPLAPGASRLFEYTNVNDLYHIGTASDTIRWEAPSA